MGLVVALAGLAVLAVLAGCGGGPGGEGRPGPAGVPDGAQPLVVQRHVDGDTVRVRLGADGPAGRRGEEVSVRLLEVDTPEVDRDGVPECYAAEASRRLAGLLPLGSRAYGVPDEELRDPYGRTLLHLWAVREGGRAVHVNRTLVSEGYARAVTYAPNDRYAAAFGAEQARARSAGRGLWGACPFFGSPG